MTTTRTISGGTGSSSSPHPHSWSDLPDDILGNIRLKIASPRDRVRVAAICRPWRATATRLPAPPAAPVLILSPCRKTGRTKHLWGSGLDDSWDMRIPDTLAGKRLVGSHQGGWVAAYDYGTHELVLVNLFSGAEVGVRPLLAPIYHAILSDDPTSSRGCILAAIGNKHIAVCKVGCTSGWTKHGWEKKMFTDIAFCSGDLYGLVYPGKELIKFKIGMGRDGSSSPVVISTHHLAIQTEHGPEAYSSYIFELYGKPSNAILAQWLPNREPFFKVFKLTDVDDPCYQHKWAEVTSFGDYALFLGPGNSKAVQVPVDVERRGFERNHIYYSKASLFMRSEQPGDEVYSMRSEDGRSVYCRKDQSVGDGLERTGYYVRGFQNASTWLHPPNL